jgi:anthranilate phosphoribosyltransferase
MSRTIELTRKLVAQHPLADLYDEFPSVADEIMAGEATPVAMAGFLTAMTAQPVQGEILAAFAQALRSAAIPLFSEVLPAPPVRFDTCGTGGDHSGTFNISTAAAFVVAGAGYPVVKHGNRGITSKSGSADVLEALGVSITESPAEAARRLIKTGFTFLFAPSYHPAMRHVGPIRKELGFRTLFNVVGPLANPAGATHQVVGVFDSSYLQPVARALQLLGVKKALVVHGHGPLDEVSLTGTTQAVLVHPDSLQQQSIDPEKLGLKLVKSSELTGGDATQNAEIIRAVLSGQGTPSQTDVILLNAAASLSLVCSSESLEEGLQLARESLTTGAALRILEAQSNKFSETKNL